MGLAANKLKRDKNYSEIKKITYFSFSTSSVGEYKPQNAKMHKEIHPPTTVLKMENGKKIHLKSIKNAVISKNSLEQPYRI